MSANILTPESCKYIIDFMEENISHFELNKPKNGYNTSSYGLNLSLYLKDKKFKEIDDILFKYVGISINTFITNNIPNNGFLLEGIQDSGYELRKIVGPTQKHVDSPDVSVVHDKITYRIASIVISLKESGDELIFPEMDIKVPLGQGTIVFFPPYWTHAHYSKWSGIDTYRVQTWLLNKVKTK